MRLPRSLRMVVAGGVATSVDGATLVALCSTGVTSAGLAAVIGCLAGGAVNFVLNRSWVFERADRPWIGQALRYAFVIVGGAAVLSGLVVAALCAAGLPVLVAKALAIVIVLVVWTYPISSRVVFAGRTSVAAAALDASGSGERGADPDALVVLRQSPA